MPHGDGKPAKRSATERAKAWSLWLVRVMDERGMENADIVALLDHPTYDSAVISNWKSGRYAPSELAAWRVADAVALPAPEVLRAAGFDEMADRVERIAAHGVQPAPPDPVLAELEKIGDRALTEPIAREYQRDLFAAQRRAELELAELRRTLARDQPPQDEEDPQSGTA